MLAIFGTLGAIAWMASFCGVQKPILDHLRGDCTFFPQKIEKFFIVLNKSTYFDLSFCKKIRSKFDPEVLQKPNYIPESNVCNEMGEGPLYCPRARCLPARVIARCSTGTVP